jgi:hypothetical protein
LALSGGDTAARCRDLLQITTASGRHRTDPRSSSRLFHHGQRRDPINDRGSAIETSYRAYLGFRAKGTVDANNAVSLELTDRICGAGPIGLCYPTGNAGDATFRARSRIAGST